MFIKQIHRSTPVARRSVGRSLLPLRGTGLSSRIAPGCESQLGGFPLVRLRPTQSRRTGFSLVELIVVMVIIGMLATMVVFRTRSYLIVSKQNAAKMEISRISEALETYYAMSDRYPTNEEGLDVLAQKSENFPEGILNKLSVDPWKRDYQYNSPGKDSAFEVICLGADGREGGEGADSDISSEDLDGKSK